MNILHKSLAGSILLMVMVAILSWNAFGALSRITDEMGVNNISATALRKHLETDMMHDAVRADILEMVLSATTGTGMDIPSIRTEMEENISHMASLIDGNKALPLPASIKDALAGVEAPLRDYFASARTLADMVAEGRMESVPAAQEDFLRKFSGLVVPMETVSDTISAHADESVATSTDAAASRKNLLLLLSGITMLLVLSIVGYAFFALALPLRRVTGVLGALGRGNLDVTVSGTARADEIGDLARSVDVFRTSLREANRLGEQARTTCASVMHTANELDTYAASLTGTVQKASHQVSSAATGAEQMAGNVSRISAATEELSSSIQEINRQITASQGISTTAVTEARTSGEIVSHMAEAAKRIGTVVELISDIANQTNLLALNATIEAARAGESGKGFAVVASEVKNLATQTAKATEDIAQQVNGIQDVAGKVVTAIEAIRSTIERGSEATQIIAAAMTEKGATTEDIARNVQEAATAAKAIADNLSDVTGRVDDVNKVSSQVETASGGLSRDISSLRDALARAG